MKLVIELTLSDDEEGLPLELCMTSGMVRDQALDAMETPADYFAARVVGWKAEVVS